MLVGQHLQPGALRPREQFADRRVFCEIEKLLIHPKRPCAIPLRERFLAQPLVKPFGIPRMLRVGRERNEMVEFVFHQAASRCIREQLPGARRDTALRAPRQTVEKKLQHIEVRPSAR